LTSIKNTLSEFSHSREDPAPQLVTFSALLNPGSEVVINSGEYIRCETWLVQSDYFDLARGEFRAPVTGVYQFLFVGHSHKGSDTYFQVHRNGGSVYSARKVNDKTTSITIPLQLSLNIDDTVRIYVSGGESAASGSCALSFSGTLIQAL